MRGRNCSSVCLKWNKELEGVSFDHKQGEGKNVSVVSWWLVSSVERAFREAIHRDGRNHLQVLPHLHHYKLQSNYQQALCERICVWYLSSHCPLILYSFDDIAREYSNFVVKASEKKTGFNQSASKKVFSEEAESFLLKSLISKGTTLSLGRRHIFSHTLQRI